MKIFRTLIVFAFMLATAGQNVAQAAAGQKTGFIPLLSVVDAKMPAQIQASQAYRRLAPRLLALQKQGTVLEYEPDFGASVVKIRYVAGQTLPAALSALKPVDTIQAAMPAQSVHSQAPHNFTPISPLFFMSLYDSCFGAENLGALSHVVGSLRDTTGRIVANYEGDADSGGSILDGCFSWAGSFSDVIPGYQLTFSIYDTTPTLLRTLSIFVPAIKFNSFNLKTAVITGSGPAGKPYQVEWLHPDWNAADSVSSNLVSGTIGASRTWSQDMSAKTFRGSDRLAYDVLQSPHFAFETDLELPSLYCALQGNYCNVTGFPFQPAHIVVVHAGQTHTFSGTFDAGGLFEADLQNAGSPIYLAAHDVVSATGVASYGLPVLTTKVVFSTNIVSGRVPANRYFDLYAYLGCGCTGSIYAQSDSLGNYSGDFTSQVDLVNMQATNIEVYYMDPTTGNITDYYRSYGP